MRQSCFKNIIRLPSLEFHASVYQELLRCLDKCSLTTNTLHFVINGDTLVFGPTEFAVMTGLKFNGFSAPLVAFALHQPVFGGKQNLMLVEGLIGYNFLIRCTHKARELLECVSREPHDAAGNQIEVSAPGLTIALFFWAYEVMPDLAAVCGRRLGSQIPMVLSLEENRNLFLSGPYSTPQLSSTPFPSLDHGSNEAMPPYSLNVDVSLQNLRMRFMVADLNRRGKGVLSRDVEEIPIAVKRRTLKGPQSTPAKPPIPILYTKAAYQRPNLGTRSVAPYMKSIPDPLLRKKDYGSHLYEDIQENMLSVSEISQKLAQLEELYHSLIASHFPAVIPPPTPMEFLSSSPQYAGVLPIEESRSVPCHRLLFKEIRGTAGVVVGGAIDSTELYPSGLDVLTVITLDDDTNFSPFKLGLCKQTHIDALLSFILRQAKAEVVLQSQISRSLMYTVCWRALRRDEWSLMEEIELPFAKGSYIEEIVLPFENMARHLPQICRNCGISPMNDGGVPIVGSWIASLETDPYLILSLDFVPTARRISARSSSNSVCK
ncbi:hypothetical protein C2S51_027541 [Perilla frutescens var. frutescens]|nr:hypothetical protein C2S51_027541 [Perilla frutescens var. frutescens]